MFGGNDVIDQDCYANITNVAEPVFTSKYASFSGEESSYGTDPVTWNGDTNCTVIWSRGSAYFAISLTNSYNAASGLTSISGSGSVTGVAVADVLFDDPIESMAYVEGQVSVDGSVTIQLQDTE
jgi:hypothetical protein